MYIEAHISSPTTNVHVIITMMVDSLPKLNTIPFLNFIEEQIWLQFDNPSNSIVNAY